MRNRSTTPPDSKPSRPRGLRVPAELERQIAEEARARGKAWSALTNELLEEAIRMRRAPGIVFADGPAGRRAVVAGTGIDVWEIIATWNSVNRDFERLEASYDWLGERPLRAALGYYQAYPREIDDRLAIEESWTPERVSREHGYASRPHRRR